MQLSLGNNISFSMIIFQRREERRTDCLFKRCFMMVHPLLEDLDITSIRTFYFCIYASFFIFSTYTATWTRWAAQRTTIKSQSMSGPERLQKEFAQRGSPDWQRTRAICIKYCWKALTEIASTTCCGRLLYVSTIAKIELAYMTLWNWISTLWP